MPNTAQAREKVWDMIRHIRIAHMVTHDGPDMHARPMYFMNTDFDGNLWFFTSMDSPKVAEIERNNQVLLLFSDPAKQNYVSVYGNAVIRNDREKIAELWSEMARAWFPEGKDDANLRLIKVEMERAEYWDSPSQALVVLYGYAVARLTGHVPKVGEHEKVIM
ncbi:MAG: hypothetical protein EBV03_05955 [Proteobacteria bacterium]|nr:hypothetical protein [Pseudomonadota bacterium]